jgi:hypothetical protein
LPIVSEVWRAERSSWKLNLALPDGCQLELFSFPAPPARVSRPEACGLRHLAWRKRSGTGARRRCCNKACHARRSGWMNMTDRRFSFARTRITCRLSFRCGLMLADEAGRLPAAAWAGQTDNPAHNHSRPRAAGPAVPGFHPFGDDLHPQLVAHGNHRLGNGAVGIVMASPE